MVEKEEIYSSKIKHNGVFSFKDFYKFCYDWLKEEENFALVEKKYSEKISGNEKEIDVEWEASKKMTDYFRFDIKVKIAVKGLTNVELNVGNAKVKTNKGSVEISLKGILARDYEGKFETNAFNKFIRSIYEKWVINNRINEFEGKVASTCDEFLGQSKAYLDLEGKR